jgi:hypothetical protein
MNYKAFKVMINDKMDNFEDWRFMKYKDIYTTQELNKILTDENVTFDYYPDGVNIGGVFDFD